MLLTLVDKQKHEWNTILILIKANFYDTSCDKRFVDKKKRSHTWWRKENMVEQHKQTN